MKVILQQDVRGQGKKGQMIDAAEGYARNYLLPRKLAIPATADAINTMNLKEKARRAEEAANRFYALFVHGGPFSCCAATGRRRPELSQRANRGACDAWAAVFAPCALRRADSFRLL